MKRNTDRRAVLLLALLPGLALAQVNDSAGVNGGATQTVAAAATTPGTPASPSPNPGSNKVDQTKEQLTKLPSAADLRPNGPITINANKAELVQGSSAVYVGNVTMDSDTLKMDGDRLELKRAADGQYVAKVSGALAHMSHTGNGPDNPSMTAQAKTMIYDSRAGTIDLAGDAQMTRGNDRTSAETIRYYLVEQRYEASGGGDSGGGKPGRVTIVIPQVTAPGQAGAAAPAAAPSPAAPAQNPAPHP